MLRRFPAIHGRLFSGEGSKVRARTLCVLILFISSVFLSSTPRAAAQGAQDDVLEVEITGERPGPNLWRVSNGDRVVWLMGTLDPLPKGITWRSREIESVLGEVGQLLPSRPDYDVSAGPITLVRFYFEVRRVKKIPGKQTLKDWLDPSLHARWMALRKRYDARDESIEKLLPVFAATSLYERALEVSKLSSGAGIERSVIKLARKHHVAIQQTEVKIEEPREVVAQFGEIPREIQVACLEAFVERLETGIETIKAQANAWALGDVAALRALPYPKIVEVCTDAVMTSERIKDMIEKNNAGWNATLEAALTGNGKPTLAVKPIYELLGANGTIEKLRARGFLVEGP